MPNFDEQIAQLIEEQRKAREAQQDLSQRQALGGLSYAVAGIDRPKEDLAFYEGQQKRLKQPAEDVMEIIKLREGNQKRQDDLQARQLDRDAQRDFLRGMQKERLEDRAVQRDLDRKFKEDQQTQKKQQSMNEIEDRRQNINAALDELDTMIAEKGTYEMFGSHNQDMDRLVDQIATDMAKLMDPNSVARPNEVELVKRGLIQPGFKNRNVTARDILKNFKNEVARRADSAYQIRGIERPKTVEIKRPGVKDPGLEAKIEQARQEGYSEEEIQQYLQGLK